jgi:hypothetical protein
MRTIGLVSDNDANEIRPTATWLTVPLSPR